MTLDKLEAAKASMKAMHGTDRAAFGMKVLVSTTATEVKWIWPAQHRPGLLRSRRLMKKLTKRLGPASKRVPCAYKMGNTLVVHPEIYAQMKAELPRD
jgi:hypothetical protein